MALDRQTEPEMYQELSPKPGQPHTHTVVFLHGRGDDAENFMKCLQRNNWVDSQRRTPMDVFPTFRWVFPTAGYKSCARPDGPRVMSQWFDTWDYLNLRYREDVQVSGLRESVERTTQLLAMEAEKLGGRYDKIVLMGFSQGGATSAHTLLNLHMPSAVPGKRQLGALVGVGSRMPFPEQSLAETRKVLALDNAESESDEVVRNTPILLEHCTDDETVLIDSGKQLRQTLEGFGASVTWREYARGGHWLHSPQGLDDLAVFLSKALSIE